MTKEEILRKYEFYNEADASFKHEIENSSVAVKLPAGAHYFGEGEECRQVALVGSGSVRVYKTGETGRQITLYYVLPGETCILTASCVLGEMGYPANAVVETDVEAVVLDAAFFRSCVDSKPAVRKFVFSMLAQRMTDVLTLLEEIAFGRMDRRISEYLIDRFRSSGEGNVIHITHEQAAADLGTAREVVSRLLKELERLGAVELSRGRITLVDEEKLHL